MQLLHLETNTKTTGPSIPGLFSTTEGWLEAIMLDLVSYLLFQLLSVVAPGGSSCVEDQTDLLGFTTQRSKCHHRTCVKCKTLSLGIYFYF